MSSYILFYGLKWQHDVQRSVYTSDFSEEKSLVVFKDETRVTLDQKQHRHKVESYHEAGGVGGREAP